MPPPDSRPLSCSPSLQVLTYHATPEVLPAAALSDGQELPTLMEGGKLTYNNGIIAGEVNNATIIGADEWSCNGIFHKIDSVLIPPAVASALSPQ